MNEILEDLVSAVNSIEEFYYHMPTVHVQNDNLNIDMNESKHYERRFVSQLKTKYDRLISEGTTGTYKEVNTDLEVIKKYIFSGKPDRDISSTFEKLSRRDDKKTFDAITTIPDFFIHKQQDNWDEAHQKLAVEVKTVPNIKDDDFYVDLFKLNVYVEKFNFQNGVFLLINNEAERIAELARQYLIKKFYTAKSKSRVYFFIKPSFKSEIEVIKFSEL